MASTIIAIIAGLLALLGYQTMKRRDAEADSKLAETKGKDSILAEEQANVNKALSDLDAGIKKMQEDKAKQSDESDSPDDRAKKWNN